MEEDTKEKSVAINIDKNINNRSENTDKDENDCDRKNIKEDVIVGLYKDVAFIPIQFESSTAIDSKVPEDKKESQTRNKHNFNVYLQQFDDDIHGAPVPDDSRRTFIVKVFFWVTICTLITALFVIIMKIYCTPKWIRSPLAKGILACTSITTLVCFFALSCSSCVTDSLKKSGFFLALMVLAGSFNLGALLVFRNLTVILYAASGTFMIVLGCLFLATLNFDFTRYYAYLMVAMLALFIFSILLAIIKLVTMENFKTLTLVLLCIGLVGYSLCLVMELQMILGGHTIEMVPENYFVATFTLLTLIQGIFRRLISLLHILEVGQEES